MATENKAITAMSGMWGLVIDDDAAMRATVKRFLHKAGVTVVREALDGKAALDLLASGAPHMIICNLAMAPMDGIALTKAVRGRPDSARRVPILMITTATDRRNVLKARDAGVNDLLLAPLNEQDFRARLKAALAKPRRFISADGYVGPDRRRRDIPPAGADRRKRRQTAVVEAEELSPVADAADDGPKTARSWDLGPRR